MPNLQSQLDSFCTTQLQSWERRGLEASRGCGRRTRRPRGSPPCSASRCPTLQRHCGEKPSCATRRTARAKWLLSRTGPSPPYCEPRYFKLSAPSGDEDKWTDQGPRRYMNAPALFSFIAQLNSGFTRNSRLQQEWTTGKDNLASGSPAPLLEDGDVCTGARTDSNNHDGAFP